jgi:hypothetical protein
MCDYSLHCVSTRPATIGDQLITSRFPHTPTRGFSAIDEPAVAVCLRPGTELAFEAEVEPEPSSLRALLTLLFGLEPEKIRHKVGRFKQINLRDPNCHHDAIEFPEGRVILLTHLSEGQRASVLQLPADTNRLAEAEHAPAGTSTEPCRLPEALRP